MNKAIFFDIDGTLLNSAKGLNTMTPAVKKSLKKLQENNNKIFIATGRPYAFLCEDILNFGFDGFILMNGSLLLMKDGSPLYRKPFNKEDLKQVLKEFHKLNIEYVLQDEKYSYINENFKELKKIYASLGVSTKYIKEDFDFDEITIFKIEMCPTNEEGLNYCKTLETNVFRHVHYEDLNLFELYSTKNTKASGILKILDHYDIEVKDSYAFGDGKNDIEMLNTVGCGIAMGNASEEIKQHADKVTLSVSEDGVAKGIEKFIFN